MGEKIHWLKSLRESIYINQEELAARLQLEGFDISRSAISSWENGRHEPPLHDARFRKSLAKVLHINVKTLLKKAGYEVSEESHSEIGDRVAHIVDQLPPDKQDLALRLIEQLAKTS